MGNLRISNVQILITNTYTTMGRVKETIAKKAEDKRRKQINQAASSYLCDQDEGDNYDAYMELIKESDKGNGDDRAADYVNVWQLLENSMSVNEMIQLIEDTIESSIGMPEFMQKIDWKLLKKQKKTLLENIDDMEKKNAEYYKETIDDLNSIINLLDSLQDSAVDDYGLEEVLVFGESTEKTEIN